MNRLREIERLVDEKLRGLFRGAAAPGEQQELVEVHRAILDEVASKVDQLPRGRRAFSYSHVTVRVRLPDPAKRRAYEAVFAEGDALEREIRHRLQDEGAELAHGLAVAVEFDSALSAPFEVSYASPAPAELQRVHIQILEGETQQPEYSFTKRRINIGRLEEVLDAQQRIVRRNDVVFLDSASSVSRAHAHLQWDAEAAAHRLYDDGSATGTTVLREGEILPVPKGGKGILLHAADELVLGRARCLFNGS